MRMAFIKDGAFYNPERGMVAVREGEEVLDELASTLSSLEYKDDVEAFDEDVRPQFRWVVRSSKFEDGGRIWKGKVIPARDVNASGIEFSSREELARLIGYK